ncbi:MAG TPA: NAD(P)H-binding protein [Thermoanaerobaculia bacterium]|jgi:NAD(P)H dehydrogenase (quinone)
MRIGISGASGQLGSATIAALKSRSADAQVIGVSRSPEKATALGIEGRFGDFDAPESLTKAFSGLDRLLIIPSSDMRPGVRATQGITAIERAVEAGVEHIVLMSSLGTRHADVPHLWESYFGPEQALMRSAKQWTILRMAYYAESFMDEVRMSLPQGTHASTSNARVNFVSRNDVAAAAAGILATEGHHGAIYQATGPAALDGEARAALVAKATGKNFAFAAVPAEQYGQALTAAGLPPFVVDAVLSIQQMWSVGGFDVTTGDVERLSGRAPRSLEDVLQEAQL